MQDHFWLFFFFAIAMTGTPGPGNLASMALGQAVGFKKSIPFLSGMIIGGVALDLLIAVGLGELFQVHPFVGTVLKFGGLVYILYLAWKILKIHAAPLETSKPFSFLEGLLLHPLNPKHWAVAISAFSQFADPTAPRFYEVTVFVAVFTICGFIFNVLWCLAGESLLLLQTSSKFKTVINLSMVILMVGATVYALLS